MRGQGAVQVKFVTRSGTQRVHGQRLLLLTRNDRCNANTWFNNRNGVAKAKLRQNQGGCRAGGPIVIPRLFDGHNKAFFFGNFEAVASTPSDTTRNRIVLNTDAQSGNLRYPVSRAVPRPSTCCSSRRRTVRPAAAGSDDAADACPTSAAATGRAGTLARRSIRT